jgi:hypothetical protein
MANLPNQQQQYQTPVGQETRGRREKGTGFTNIGKFLQANTGASGQMAQGIGQNISTKAGELQQDVNKAGTQFENQYQQQYGATLGPQGTLGQARQVIPGVSNTGINVGGMSEADASKMGTDINKAQYTGPVQYENQAQLLNRAANLNALNQISQAQLLQGVGMRTGPYTMGETMFDVGLLSQDPRAEKAIQEQKEAAMQTAAQTAQQAGLAEQRAQALTSAVESEKSDVKKDILSTLAGMQQQAKLKAENYLNQAGRIKDILVGNIPESDITAQDRAMMADLTNYGIQNVNFDTSEEDINKQILQAISRSGNTAYSDQSSFDLQDRNVAKNLALISGDKDLAKKIEQSGIDKGVFRDSAEGVKTQTDILEEKRAAEQAEFDRIGKALTNYAGMFTGENPDEFNWLDAGASAAMIYTGASTYNPLLVMAGIYTGIENLFRDAEDDINTGFDAGARGNYVNVAKDILGPETVDAIRNKWYSRAEEQGFLGMGGSEIEDREAEFGYLREVQETLMNRLNNYGQKLEKRRQATMSLQDYINQKFGITPQSGQGM